MWDGFDNRFDFNDDLTDSFIDIWIKRRGGRSYITTIEGLNDNLDIDKISEHLRKTLGCGSCVKKGLNGKYIQLQGDHRQFIKDFLIEQQIANKEDIKIHGF
jgi:translation initiation factor 1